tara:strand:+ start:125 stop:1054 length:930 start_codon:yes stop_codon:yes gene_type:complete
MKLKSIILFLNFFFIILNTEASSSIENKIILKVENEIITNFEIRNKILSTLVLSNQEINQSNINNLKKEALEFLIQHKLRKIELSKFNFKSDREQLINYLNSISGNNIDELKIKFKNNNIDFDLFLDEIKTQFKWQKLIYKIYVNKIQIDEISIDKELKEIIKRESELEEFKISEIEVLLNGDESDNKRIDDIKKQIKDIGFEKAALKFSTSNSSASGGSLGWISSKSLSKPIYEILIKMNVNEISEPIKRPNSVLFLKLDEKKISKLKDINIETLKKNLINRKRNDMFALYSRSHLSKLKNTSLIEYK